jgi:hypothetical protein
MPFNEIPIHSIREVILGGTVGDHRATDGLTNDTGDQLTPEILTEEVGKGLSSFLIGDVFQVRPCERMLTRVEFLTNGLDSSKVLGSQLDFSHAAPPF